MSLLLGLFYHVSSITSFQSRLFYHVSFLSSLYFWWVFFLLYFRHQLRLGFLVKESIVKILWNIKSLFLKSIDKKAKIFTFIFHPVLLHFFDFFPNELIPLSYIFLSQQKLSNFLHYWQSYRRLKKQST